MGYIGDTDVRIDTSAHGQSWDNEVINKQQFEEGLRQEEPDVPELTDEELDELPISAVVDGTVQTFPDAAALDEAINAEPTPEPLGTSASRMNIWRGRRKTEVRKEYRSHQNAILSGGRTPWCYRRGAGSAGTVCWLGRSGRCL